MDERREVREKHGLTDGVVSQTSYKFILNTNSTNQTLPVVIVQSAVIVVVLEGGPIVLLLLSFVRHFPTTTTTTQINKYLMCV